MATAEQLRIQEKELEKASAEKRTEAEKVAFEGDRVGERVLMLEEQRELVRMKIDADTKETTTRLARADEKERQAKEVEERDPRAANDLREEAEIIRARAKSFEENVKVYEKREVELTAEHDQVAKEREEYRERATALDKEADELAESAEEIETKADDLEGVPAAPDPAMTTPTADEATAPATQPTDPTPTDEAARLEELAKQVRAKRDELEKPLEDANVARLEKVRERDATKQHLETAEKDAQRYEDERKQKVDEAVALEEKAAEAEAKGDARSAEELLEERDLALQTSRIAERAAESATAEAARLKPEVARLESEATELYEKNAEVLTKVDGMGQTADKLQDKARAVRDEGVARTEAEAAHAEVAGVNEQIAGKIQESRDVALKQEDAFIKYREGEARLDALTGEKRIVEAKVAKMREEAKQLEGSPDAELLKDQLKWREQRLTDIDQRITQTTTDVKTFKDQSDTLYKQGKAIQEEVGNLHTKINELSGAAAADVKVTTAVAATAAIQIDPKELEAAGVSDPAATTEETTPTTDPETTPTTDPAETTPTTDPETAPTTDPTETIDDSSQTPTQEGTPGETTTDPGGSIDDLEPIGPVKVDTPAEAQPAASSEAAPDLFTQEPAAEVSGQAAAAAIDPDPSIAAEADPSVDLETQPAADAESVPLEPVPSEPEPFEASVEPEPEPEVAPDPASEAVGID